MKIKDVVTAKNRKGRDFIAVEFTVMDAEAIDRHPVGSERTWLQMLDNDAAPKNIRGFLVNLLDIPDSSLSDEMIDRAFARDAETGLSCLAGLKVNVFARIVRTKAGNDFTLLDFTPASEDQHKIL